MVTRSWGQRGLVIIRYRVSLGEDKEKSPELDSVDVCTVVISATDLCIWEWLNGSFMIGR